ncbi:vitamin B12 ABC transporter ATP-binding protein BtuD [Pluralibacter gergoviae]|uniref:vitamin B12 ABC transporter ATP-binding protein BtuD n=1 Tax=Pluralibacter gergoviae TaxID=61647 RepID=UPI0006517903|nr:vitamin B12 ABC transporter ATP-binding protein BtuD [Pluralibacter gergoviae]KMK07833.1 vitamin B12-transporter ATPase [Pluralibacter gergoviae]MCK1068882.1 vitamin B12 ABC transporter ATP-binding protein BtuD [Pluralibacter gergoviae]MCV7757198.1 vitamin B12 ABC transporter ATP-binding protein BtuD [Pluralibacter gergoviae]PHH47138.1 vitamin B12 ABC transporter ATP-binding protein BtuD [Pluralibacter gergoviae]HDS1236342.1 vitamin B12 ABC transporter ATP-binding protein BtuD [Pluralibacte
MPLMQLQGVAQARRLRPIDAAVDPGETLHLVGPNGAGKSTLLNRLAGMSRGEGRILFNGRPLDEWPAAALARRRAWLCQQQMPPFAMPVWHYLALHQPAAVPDALMQEVCGALALSDKLGRPADQLSGGEWQRVRLAAVVLQIHPQINPEGQLLLLDEPMNSLDVAQQSALDGLLAGLSAAGIAIVTSSHDLNHSLRYAEQVWLMRDGGLLAGGKTRDVLTADNLTAAYRMPFQFLQAGDRRFIVAAGSPGESLQPPAHSG